jgi:hypothetical protein
MPQCVWLADGEKFQPSCDTSFRFILGSEEGTESRYIGRDDQPADINVTISRSRSVNWEESKRPGEIPPDTILRCIRIFARVNLDLIEDWREDVLPDIP